MTPSSRPLDGTCSRGKHWRDHRSYCQNIIPGASGACKALVKIIPQVKGKLCGMALRVPVLDVSVLDITVRLNKDANLDEIAGSVEKARRNKMRNIIDTSYDDTVSSDYMRAKQSCILDLRSSLALTSRSFKLICWYENEYSYACRIVDTLLFVEEQLRYAKKSIPPIEVKGKELLGPRSSNSMPSTSSDDINILKQIYLDQNYIADPNSSFWEKKQLYKTEENIQRNSKNLPIEKQTRANKPDRDNVVDKLFYDVNKDIVCTSEKANQTDRKNKKKVRKMLLSRLDQVSIEVENIIKSKVDTALKEINDEVLKGSKHHEVEGLKDNENINLIPKSRNTCNKKIIRSRSFMTNNFFSPENYGKKERSHREANECERPPPPPPPIEQHHTGEIDIKHYDVLRNKDNLVDDTVGNIFADISKSTIIPLNDDNENHSYKKSPCNAAILDDSKKQEVGNETIKIRKMLSSKKRSSKDLKLLFKNVSDRYKLTNEPEVKSDLYDKLDSGTNSDTSLQMFETKSQVIDITDLTNSTEDLARLDKICRIIEISDELSDNLFSALSEKDKKTKKKWSFKDLCKRIQLDDFCNKVFGQA